VRELRLRHLLEAGPGEHGPRVGEVRPRRLGRQREHLGGRAKRAAAIFAVAAAPAVGVEDEDDEAQEAEADPHAGHVELDEVEP
jgi:hypothetical protein